MAATSSARVTPGLSRSARTQPGGPTKAAIDNLVEAADFARSAGLEALEFRARLLIRRIGSSGPSSSAGSIGSPASG
jgi:hypothetical protein